MSDLRRYLLAPPAHAVAIGRDWWTIDIAAITKGPRLARENARLASQIAILSEQNRALAADEAENKRLRALLGFRSHIATVLWPAEVIAVKPSPLRDSITLSIGDVDGVKRKMVVIGPTGSLVGQVTDVTRTTSDVLLLTDDLSSVGVRIVPNNPPPGKLPPTVGICTGDHSAMLNLIDAPQNADIAPGDRVVTSGLGSIYPAGVPVGTVQTVSEDSDTLLKGARVVPDTDFDHMQDVFVLPGQM